MSVVCFCVVVFVLCFCVCLGVCLGREVFLFVFVSLFGGGKCVIPEKTSDCVCCVCFVFFCVCLRREFLGSFVCDLFVCVSPRRPVFCYFVFVFLKKLRISVSNSLIGSNFRFKYFSTNHG